MTGSQRRRAGASKRTGRPGADLGVFEVYMAEADDGDARLDAPDGASMRGVHGGVARCRWGLLVLAAGACGSTAAPPAGGPVVTISIAQGGAPAAALEREAVEPIEQAVGSLAGVRALRSTIEPGRALVVVSLDASRPIELAAAEVMRAVRELQPRLPEDLEPPVVSRVDPDGPALGFQLSGAPAAVLSELARDAIARRLEPLPGVGAVELDGAAAREVVIWVDLGRLAAFDLALSELAAAIRGGSVDVPAGRLDATAATLRVVAAPGTLEELGALVVATRGGAPIRVRDVARIEDLAAIERGPLSIRVRIQRGADREAVSARVRSAIRDLRGELPPGLVLVERDPPGRRAPAPLAASLRGPDREALRTIAARIESALRASDAISEVVREPPPGAPEQTIDLDRARAARLGISRAELAPTLRAALGGYPIGALRSGAHERDLVLRLDGGVAELLARVTVRAPGGASVPLSAVAAAATSSSEHLLRLDREPAIELSAYVAPGRSPAAARRRLAELARDLPPGHRAIVRPRRRWRPRALTSPARRPGRAPRGVRAPGAPGARRGAPPRPAPHGRRSRC